PLHLRRHDINILTFAGTPETEKVIQSYGLKAVGTRTRLTGKPIYELTCPPMAAHHPGSPVAFLHYHSLKLLLIIYQLCITGQENFSDLAQARCVAEIRRGSSPDQ